MVYTMILLTNLPLGLMLITLFITSVRPLLKTELTSIFRFFNYDKERMAGATGQVRMLTPSWHPILSLVFLRVHVCLVPVLYILNTVRYYQMSFFKKQLEIIASKCIAIDFAISMSKFCRFPNILPWKSNLRIVRFIVFSMRFIIEFIHVAWHFTAFNHLSPKEPTFKINLHLIQIVKTLWWIGFLWFVCIIYVLRIQLTWLKYVL